MKLQTVLEVLRAHSQHLGQAVTIIIVLVIWLVVPDTQLSLVEEELVMETHQQLLV
jgi:hypothetical protein